MKKVLMILVVLAVVALIWMTLIRKIQNSQPVKTQVGGTTVTVEEDLDKELGTTVDDGGAADFVELQNSAEGL